MHLDVVQIQVLGLLIVTKGNASKVTGTGGLEERVVTRHSCRAKLQHPYNPTMRTTQPILRCWNQCWYSNRVCSDLESLSRCVCIQIWQEWHWVWSLHFSLQHLWHCGSWWLWCRRVWLTTAFLLHYVGDSPDRVIHRSYIRGTLGTGILYN